MRGIGRYATGILVELRRRGIPVLAVASRRIHSKHMEVAGSSQVESIGRWRGHIWEQCELPRFLRRLGEPALLNVVNTAPIRYQRQATVIHDLSFLRMPSSFAPRFRLFYQVVVPRAAAASAVIVTDSQFSKREMVDLLRVAPERVEVVYPFVGDEMLRLAAERNSASPGDYALMVSSLNPRKNLRRGLAGFHAARVSGLRLVLVGASSTAFSSPEIRDLITDQVDVRSDVTDRELVALYRGARLFLYPSLYEGFGIPPLEAMMCDCPVVAARAASLPEVCGDAAHYVDPFDVDSIADGIRTVAESDVLRARLIRHGQALQSGFRVERTVERLCDVMRRVADDQ